MALVQKRIYVDQWNKTESTEINQCIYGQLINNKGFSGGLVVKTAPANAGNTGSISELRRSPGGGDGNPLPYSCLGNLMDRGAW